MDYSYDKDGFPVKRINIPLVKTKPAVLDANQMQKELNGMGLTCDETSVENLVNNKNTVLGGVGEGTHQAFFICNTDNLRRRMSVLASSNLDGDTLESDCRNAFRDYLSNVNNIIASNWKPHDSAFDFTEKLSTIGLSENMDMLKNATGINYNGKIENYSENGKQGTTDAIVSLFRETVKRLSRQANTGIDKGDLEAAINNTIVPPVDPNAKDYDSGEKERIIFLVDNYNEATGNVDGLGIINIKWHLKIDNYKSKSKDTPKGSDIKIEVRSVFYGDPNTIEAHYSYILAHNKTHLAGFDAFPVINNLVIYDTLPSACQDTYIHSLPVRSDKDGILKAIVMYSEGMSNLGYIDNRNSNTATSYSKSVESGFTFTTTQSIEAGVSVSAEFAFVSAEFSVKVGLSFSEQWNKTETETISFEVPSNSEAYLYQGFMMCRILEYDIRNKSYSYGDTARFNTMYLKTTEKPIVK